MNAEKKKNTRSGCCYLCGASTRTKIYVEDGVPFHHPAYFDDGGWVYVCSNWRHPDSMCKNRRDANTVEIQQEIERQAILRRAQDDASRLLTSVWEDRIASLVANLDMTGYSKYWNWGYTKFQRLDLLLEVPKSIDARTPDQLGVDRIYRVSEGYVVRYETVTRLYAQRETCDEYRKWWAACHDVTRPEATRQMVSPYIGPDQRRLYELAAQE